MKLDGLNNVANNLDKRIEKLNGYEKEKKIIIKTSNDINREVGRIYNRIKCRVNYIDPIEKTLPVLEKAIKGLNKVEKDREIERKVGKIFDGIRLKDQLKRSKKALAVLEKIVGRLNKRETERKIER